MILNKKLKFIEKLPKILNCSKEGSIIIKYY